MVISFEHRGESLDDLKNLIAMVSGFDAQKYPHQGQPVFRVCRFVPRKHADITFGSRIDQQIDRAEKNFRLV